MTKQEFLNTPAKTVGDAVAQQILNSESMTSLKQLQRSLKATYKQLYKDEWKAIPLKDLMLAIEKASFLIVEWQNDSKQHGRPRQNGGAPVQKKSRAARA